MSSCTAAPPTNKQDFIIFTKKKQDIIFTQ
jgi:hypothetical protein